ncbi:MAG: hypothetical protein AB1545_17545 [Thermodesulfobacteriota bacterium]
MPVNNCSNLFHEKSALTLIILPFIQSIPENKISTLIKRHQLDNRRICRLKFPFRIGVGPMIAGGHDVANPEMA